MNYSPQTAELARRRARFAWLAGIRPARRPGRRSRLAEPERELSARIELRIAGAAILGPMTLAQLATVIKYGGYEPGADLLGLEPIAEPDRLATGKAARPVELRVWPAGGDIPRNFDGSPRPDRTEFSSLTDD